MTSVCLSVTQALTYSADRSETYDVILKMTVTAALLETDYVAHLALSILRTTTSGELRR